MICKNHKTKNQFFILVLHRKDEKTMHFFLKLRRTTEKSLKLWKQSKSTGQTYKFPKIQEACLSITQVKPMLSFWNINVIDSLNLRDKVCMIYGVLFKFWSILQTLCDWKSLAYQSVIWLHYLSNDWSTQQPYPWNNLTYFDQTLSDNSIYQFR